MSVKLKVFQHYENIRRYCPGIDPVTVLALVQIESGGNTSAHRPGSGFHGLLQMNTAYLSTALPHFPFKADALLGDSVTPFKALAAIYERTRHWHMGDPDLVAFGHKAGMGALKRYATKHAHEKLDDAIPAIVEHYKAKGVNIPNAPEYLRRFREAREEWQGFLAAQTAPSWYDETEGVCWLPDEDSDA